MPFRKLESLQTLYIRANYLESLPDAKGDLKSLQTVDISSNHQFRSLPHTIGMLESF